MAHQNDIWTTSRTSLWQTAPEVRLLGLVNVRSIALSGTAELEGLLPNSLPFVGIADGATLEIRYTHVGRVDALDNGIPIVRLSDCHFEFFLPDPVDLQDDHALTVFARVLCRVEVLDPGYTPPQAVIPAQPRNMFDRDVKMNPIEFERRVRSIVRRMLGRI